jgi:hypothetical protein
MADFGTPRNTPRNLAAWARVAFTGAPSAVFVGNDGGFSAVAYNGAADATLTGPAFELANADVTVTTECDPGGPSPLAASVILDGPAGTIRVVAARGCTGFCVSLRHVIA